MVVDDLLVAVLLGLQSAQPLTNQVFHFLVFRVDIAYEDKGEVCRVGKTCFVDRQCLVQVDALQRRSVEDDGTLRVVGAHHLYRVGERRLGVLVAVGQLVAEDAYKRLIGLFVATRSCEIEIGQLQHRFQIFHSRTALYTFGLLRYLRAHRYRLAGQRFLQLRRVETTDTRELDN